MCVYRHSKNHFPQNFFFLKLKEDENTNHKIDESNAPVSSFINEETVIEAVDTGTLFGFDHFNQLESNQ